MILELLGFLSFYFTLNSAYTQIAIELFSHPMKVLPIDSGSENVEFVSLTSIKEF